jgi:hypothetical protein
LNVLCSIEDVLPKFQLHIDIVTPFYCSLIGRALISGEYQWISDDIPFSLSQISDADNLGLCQVHISFHVLPWLGSLQTAVFTSLYYYITNTPTCGNSKKHVEKQKEILRISRKDNHFP